MDELYDEARNWCAANGQYLHMTGLTKDLLGLDTISADYPLGTLCVLQVFVWAYFSNRVGFPIVAYRVYICFFW